MENYLVILIVALAGVYIAATYYRKIKRNGRRGCCGCSSCEPDSGCEESVKDRL